MKALASLFLVVCLVGCSMFEDAATSIAYDIERGVRHLGRSEGSTHVITHDAKSRASGDARTIKLQFDKVGALIVWYMDAEGKVLESGSTNYLSRFVDIPETIIVDLPIATPVSIELKRRDDRAIVARVF